MKQLNLFLVGCLAFCLLPTAIFAQNAKIERLKVLGAEMLLADTLDTKLAMGLESVYSQEGIEEILDRIITRDGNMLISAVPTDDLEQLKADLEAVGAKDVVIGKNFVRAWVSPEQLPQLEDVQSMVCALPEFIPTTNVGLTTSQGDAAMRSDLIRAFQGIDGTGVTIGILSDSYNSLGGADEGVANGDLPGPGNPNGYTEPVEILVDLPPGAGSDEGRGMAELIHDVAPGAKLKFRTAFLGLEDFALGILELAASGCDIIVDDVGYFTEPTFQDGFIAQAVTIVTELGVTYFSAAGNSNRLSYEAPFNPSGITIPGLGELHDFGGGDFFQQITLPPGGFINYWLHWDDHSRLFSDPTGPAPESDFNFFIFEPISGILIPGSNEANDTLGAPYEFLGVINNGTEPIAVDLIIARVSGSSNKTLKYIDYGDGILPDEYNTFSGTCVGHSQAEGGFGIGAVTYFNSNEFGLPVSNINNFSSPGGVPILLDPQGNRLPAPILREAPLVSGPDGANTSFFPVGGFDFEGDGFPNFFGTSAAAPHLAAIAALLKEKDPSLTPEEIGLALTNTAEDMDDEGTVGFDPGFDFNTGYGMVQADAALASISDEACVYRFQVFATKTGELIGTLRDGDVIDLVDVPEGLINIVALVEGGPDKEVPAVRFDLSGQIKRKQIDRQAPYALFGDNNGKLKDWYVHVGDYKLRAGVPGTKKKHVEIAFSVINSIEVQAFLLVDAKTDQVIGELPEVLDLSTLPTNRFNILAQLNDGRGNSRGVRFNLSGAQKIYSFDHLAPYAAFKDNQGDFYAWKNPELGEYTLEATPIGNWNRNSAGKMLTQKFTIINGESKTGTDAHPLRLAEEEIDPSDFIFNVHPNPSADFVSFAYQGTTDKKVKLEIFTMTGQRVFKIKKKEELALDVDFTQFGPGLYVAKVTDNGIVKTQQIAIH